MAGKRCRAPRVAGHFGELIQGRLGPDGPVALVTLPCSAFETTCDWRLGRFALHQAPGGAVMTLGAARRLLDRLRLPARGAFRLSGGPPPGGGGGASTAARIALARAAAQAAGLPRPCPEVLARACLESEGASDPLMFPEPARLLWASRAGRVIARLPAPPRFDLIGGFFGPPRRTDPADVSFADISDLADAWPAATADSAAAARLASESARRLLAHRGLEDPTEGLAARLGALGFAVAHTGSARALLYHPGTVPEDAAGELRRAGFTRIVRFDVGGTPCSPPR